MNVDSGKIQKAKNAAIEVLRHNSKGPFNSLPRVAGWGYPEPYTRDIMITAPGILLSKDARLVESLETVLKTLAKNQSTRGQMPSLAHDRNNLGSSDATPLFLMATGMFRKALKRPNFLQNAVERAMMWMDYQCPEDNGLTAQQPTSDWRDEQWVWGYGLFVNTVVYAYLRLFEKNEKADKLKKLINKNFSAPEKPKNPWDDGPHYSLYFYKFYNSRRFDLLSNSLAILTGIASTKRANAIIDWIEDQCKIMKENRELAVDLPPNFFPFIYPGEPDWRPRYQQFNQPGEYHNGGIWPFICGFHVAALTAVKRHKTAEDKIIRLVELITQSKEMDLNFGFNEWHRAQNGAPAGQNWQSWSASMLIYAINCVEKKATPFFDEIRKQ